MNDMRPWKKVVGAERYYWADINPSYTFGCPTAGNWHFKLDCGHEEARKGSAFDSKSLPKKLRCTMCPWIARQ